MASGPDFVEIANAVASVINFESTPTLFPWPIPWTHRFRIIEPAIGARLIVQETGDQELMEVPITHVANCIVAWLRLQKDPESLVTFRKAKEVAEFWMAFAEPVPMDEIKSVRWLSEPGYTWRRLPWDQSVGKTPTWDKILSKMTNASAFRQWLGSLFYEEAAQHQYVWVHGMGNDGKGSMNRFLKRVFGRSYRSKQPPAPGDKFWTYGLIGARLVVFPDCNSQGFTTGGMFKSLSGGDPVDVEAKGRMSFTAELGCKFLFFSNEKPNISCEDADMRRIIYCEFTEKTKKEDSDPDFESKLWSEGGDFLSRCVREYLEACPRHQSIVSEKDNIEDWISVNDEPFQSVFDQHFMQPNELYRTAKGLADLSMEQIDKITVEPNHMLGVVTDAFNDQRSQKAFRDWLYKKYGVQKRGIKRGGNTVYRYVGIHRRLTAKAAREMHRVIASLRIAPSTPSTFDTLT